MNGFVILLLATAVVGVVAGRGPPDEIAGPGDLRWNEAGDKKRDAGAERFLALARRDAFCNKCDAKLRTTNCWELGADCQDTCSKCHPGSVCAKWDQNLDKVDEKITGKCVKGNCCECSELVAWQIKNYGHKLL